MSFLESPRFPDDLSQGVTFGPEFVTGVAAVQSGAEQRNRVRERALCMGECAHAVRTVDQLRTLLAFFRSVGGRHVGFRFKDWSDFSLADADSLLTLVAGTVNQYQITRLYSIAAGFEERRPIRKPVAGTVVLRDLGAVVTAGAAAGQYAVDTTTGIVTLVASQSRSITTHTPGAQHSLQLGSALAPNVAPGQVVVVTGVTGTAAAVLNDRQHTVASVAGAVVTLATATAGLTASGGTLNLYRQAGGLTASCEFDVPVRFDTDHMATGIQAYQIFSWGQIPIREIQV
jgi:uncharacterized protein (TIGR02217 family)